MAEFFPWLYIQNIEFMYRKQGTNLCKTMLYCQSRLYDILRLLEVARTVLPSPMYCTWFNMVKFVVPNQDTMRACHVPPRDAARVLDPGCMTRDMLRQ